MTKYWLADKAEAIISRFEPLHTGAAWHTSNPMGQTWVRNTLAYYANVLATDSIETSLLYDGEAGELVRMMVPQARSLVRQFVTIVSKQKLAFKATAEKTDSDVIQVTRLANAVGVQIVEEEDMDLKAEDLLEGGCVQGMGFLEACWRSDRGGIYTIDKRTDQALYRGKMEIANRSVFDVLWNWGIKNWADQPVIETRCKINRWTLVAQFPKLKSAILALPSASDITAQMSAGGVNLFDEDMVWVYKVYATPGPALRSGRMIIYSNHETVYYDGINPYGCIPVEPLIPERIGSYSLGYPMLSNLLPCQEMLDHSFSAWATNQSATAVQNIAVPRGANVTYEDLAGMNWFSYTPMPGIPGGGKPEGLNLGATSQETQKFIPVLMEHMQQLSNISAALRGQPPPGVTSGRAIATLLANALEFMSSGEKAWVRCLEKVMMHGIRGTCKFAKLDQVVQITGRNFETYAKKFVGKDLESIKGMKLQRSNPMMQSQAGRMELLEMMEKGGKVKSPQHFFSILEGAPPQEAYETELSEEDLIRSENELLLDGKLVMGLNSDDHAGHFRSHMGLLNNPDVRHNNQTAKAITDHARWHYEQAQQVEPLLMAMARTGVMPQGLPPPGGEGPPPGEGEGPPPGAPMMDGGGEAKPAEPAEDMLGRVA